MNQPSAILTRTDSSEDGTFGILRVTIEGLTSEFHTLEPPWMGNQEFISCIPVGRYSVSMEDSAKFGRALTLERVPDRTYILFHKGNWAFETQGCILVGMGRGHLSGEPALLGSGIAIGLLENLLGDQSFDLFIINE